MKSENIKTQNVTVGMLQPDKFAAMFLTYELVQLFCKCKVQCCSVFAFL